jgi:hypothetical protein
MDGELDGVLSWREQSQRGVSIGFTFLPHVIIPDKRNGVHCLRIVFVSMHFMRKTESQNPNNKSSTSSLFLKQRLHVFI